MNVWGREEILKKIVLCGYLELQNLDKQSMHSGFVARYRQIRKEMQFWLHWTFPPQLVKRRRAKHMQQPCLRNMWA